MHQRRTLQLATAAAALLSVAIHAQSSKWADPYLRGVKAIDAKNYAEAVVQLEQAVAADPKAEARKYVEGVFRLDYFPYFYLGIAYTELHQYDRAQQNFEKAKATLPRNDRKLQTRFSDYQGQLQAALTAAKPPPPPTPRPAVPTAPAPATPAAPDNAAARALALQLADEGRRALPDSLSSARVKFQQAEQTFPGLKETADGRDQIRRREEQYAQFKAGAEQDERASDWKAARSKLDQAKEANPEQFAADNLVARVNYVIGRMNAPAPPLPATPTPSVNALPEESKRLFDEGQLLASQGKYADADVSYTTALQRNANNLEAKSALDASRSYASLIRDGRRLKDTKGGVEAARKRFEDARTLDPRRFDRDGLGPTLNALLKANGQDPTKEALRQGLIALLSGEAERSIAILEPALDQTGATSSTSSTQRATRSAAPLHAYLGVAYATRALTSATEDERTRLSGIAQEQFRQAVSSQPDYRLSPALVSPKILAMFEQARR